jgi:signal transduction histidine kinase
MDRLPTLQSDQMLDGVARQVTSDINHTFSKERLERAAMRHERVRLARELHDGLLQSLTAASLQLKALSRVIDKNPHVASKRLRELEAMIADEHRELRSWIETLKPAPNGALAPAADLIEALEKLCRRAEAQWQLRVRLAVSNREAVPRVLADDIYRLVQEALNNMGRHAHARSGRVNIDFSRARVLLIISDDGRGFSFNGRRDSAQLTANGLGPTSLRERVASLGGELVLTSSSAGSQLCMTIPIQMRALNDSRPVLRRA